MASYHPQYAEIFEAQHHLHRLQEEHWRQFELFTPQWWALLAVLIAPWIIWRRLVDRTRLAAILGYGMYTLFVVTALDAVGVALEFWIYPIKLAPLLPHTVPIDWSLLPVLNMLLFQYFPRWRSFAIAQVLAGMLLAFAGEPFAEWIGVYQALNWQHTWSAPLYAVKGLFGKWLIETIAASNKNEYRL